MVLYYAGRPGGLVGNVSSDFSSLKKIKNAQQVEND